MTLYKYVDLFTVMFTPESIWPHRIGGYGFTRPAVIEILRAWLVDKARLSNRHVVIAYAVCRRERWKRKRFASHLLRDSGLWSRATFHFRFDNQAYTRALSCRRRRRLCDGFCSSLRGLSCPCWLFIYIAGELGSRSSAEGITSDRSYNLINK